MINTPGFSSDLYTSSSEGVGDNNTIVQNKDPLLNEQPYVSILQGLIQEFNGVPIGGKNIYVQLRAFQEYGKGEGPSVPGFIGADFWGRAIGDQEMQGNPARRTVLSVSGLNEMTYYFRTVQEMVDWLVREDKTIETIMKNRVTGLRDSQQKITEYTKERSGKGEDDTYHDSFTPYQTTHIENLFSEQGNVGEMITLLEKKYFFEKIREKLSAITGLISK